MAEEETVDVIETPPAEGAQPEAPAEPPKDVIDSGDEDAADKSTDGDLLSDDGASDDEGVPDQYTFEPPEGAELDEATLDAFKEIAKDLGVTQSQFQKLVEYDIERSQAAMEQAVGGWNDRVNGWRDDARADGEIGGKNFDASVKDANKLVKTYGDDSFRALLRSPSEDNPDGLAIGNHPAFLRFVNRIAKVIGEPDPVEGDGRQAPDTSFSAKAAKMYPSMQKK